MQVLIWIASGILVGWVAGLLMKGRDYGVSGNLILGALGSLVGGWLVHALGFSRPSDIVRQGLVSLLGAMVVLGVARWLKPVARQTRRALGEVGSAADLEGQIRKLGEMERRAWARLFQKHGAPMDPNAVFDAQMTFGQRVADQVASFGGSWTFIGLFLLLMFAWMVVNSVSPQKFDPFPYILLNLVLSCLAALQAPVIMMSQNRQAAKDRLDARSDYDVNLRAEMEIQKVHIRLDELRERDWVTLVDLQQRQISLLEQIIRDLRGLPHPPERGGEIQGNQPPPHGMPGGGSGVTS